MRTLALLTLVLALAGCGKYGPPVRRPPAQTSDDAPTAQEPAPEETRDDEKPKR
jgi:predicted small lipoprotein YifL